MTNTLMTDLEIHRRYDLKGSWIGRKTKVSNRKDPQRTLKDVDLKESPDRVFVDKKMKEMLMASLRRDAAFLEHNGIIDYSVLLGIHDHDKDFNVKKNLHVFPSILQQSNSFQSEKEYEPPYFQVYKGGFQSVNRKQTYLLGIIDFLTQYGAAKRLERFFKTVRYFNSGGISVMPARAYAKRFLEFMNDVVIVDEDPEEFATKQNLMTVSSVRKH